MYLLAHHGYIRPVPKVAAVRTAMLQAFANSIEHHGARNGLAGLSAWSDIVSGNFRMQNSLLVTGELSLGQRTRLFGGFWAAALAAQMCSGGSGHPLVNTHRICPI